MEPQIGEMMATRATASRSARTVGAGAPLEGLTRGVVGMHAGGVLIAPGKITDFCPLYRRRRTMPRRCRSSTRTTSRAVGP